MSTASAQTAIVASGQSAAATAVQQKFLSPRQVLSRLTRIQGPEQEQQMIFSPLSTNTLPNSLKTDKFIWGLIVRFHGRLTVGGSSFTPLLNSLWNLFQEFRVNGTHVKYGALVPYRMRAATARDLAVLFGSGFTPTAYVSKNGGTVGGSSVFDGVTTATYDVDVMWPIIFPPLGIPFSDQIVNGALKGPDWAGDLHLAMDAGDGTSLGTTSGNITFSAYGSSTGNPLIYVSSIRPNMTVALMNAISPAITFKSYKDLATLLQGANQTGQTIQPANIGKGTVRFIMKSGVQQTSTSSGVTVFASLSNAIITRAYPSLDGKPLKNPYSNKEVIELENYFMKTDGPAGYQVLDFIEGGNVLSAFPSQGLTSARRFEVDGDITAASNQGGEQIQEELLGSPVILPVPVPVGS